MVSIEKMRFGSRELHLQNLCFLTLSERRALPVGIVHPGRKKDVEITPASWALRKTTDCLMIELAKAMRTSGAVLLQI